MHKLSESINFYQKFLEYEKTEKMTILIKKHTISYIGICIILGVAKYIEYTQNNQKRLKLQNEQDIIYGHLSDKNIKPKKT